MFDEYKSKNAPKNQRVDAREPMREEDLGQVHPS